MRCLRIFLLLAVCTHLHPSDAQTSSNALALNDEGVAALQKENWQLSMKKFQAALAIEPDFEEARKNLAVAHNNFGLHLASREHEYLQAVRQLHRAVYLDPDNATTVDDLNILIRDHFHMDPKVFADRLKLASQAKRDNDLAGAVVEYRAALKFKSDPSVREKLADVQRVIKKSHLQLRNL